jgi:hypothetical protein
MEPRLPSITDEDLVNAGPSMRYLVAQRLEEIWGVCQPHLDGTAPRPDHRYVETATRVLKEMARIYRLDAPASAPARETTALDPAVMVEAQLRELEARVSPGTPGPEAPSV